MAQSLSETNEQLQKEFERQERLNHELKMINDKIKKKDQMIQ